METFGRGCLYSILFIIGLFVLSLLIGQSITIPFIIFIPVIVILFFVAKRDTDHLNNNGTYYVNKDQHSNNNQNDEEKDKGNNT